MSKIKRIGLALIIAFICVVSFGCAQISFSTTLKNSGAIIQSIAIDLSSISSKREVIDVIKEYNKQLDKAYKDNLVGKFNNIYTSEAYKNLSNEEKFNYIELKNPNYILSDLETLETNSNNVTKLFYKRTFVSIYSYLMYFYPDVLEADIESGKIVVSEDYTSLVDIPFNSTFEEEERIFVSSYVQTCYPFYYNGEMPKLIYDATISGNQFLKGQKLSEVLSNLTGRSEEEVELFFDFSTPYSRLHSDGNVAMTENGYTHSWSIDSINGSVTLWRNYANYVAWYVLAGCIGLAIIMVGFIVIRIIKTKKKNKGLDILKKIDEFENK